MPHRRFGWLVLAAILAAVGALVWGSASVPVVESAGNPLYLHGSGAAPGCAASTMNQVIGVRAPSCSVTSNGSTLVFGFNNIPSQTVSAGVWSLKFYWSGGTGSVSDTITVSVGAVAGVSCAGFVATIPNGGSTWTTTYGSNGANTTSPVTVNTSASQTALVIPAGGSLCLRVALSHGTGGATSFLYDGTTGVADTQLIPPSTVVPESVLGFLGLALAIPVITARRRLLSFFKVRL